MIHLWLKITFTIPNQFAKYTKHRISYVQKFEAYLYLWLCKNWSIKKNMRYEKARNLLLVRMLHFGRRKHDSSGLFLKQLMTAFSISPHVNGFSPPVVIW